MQAGKSDTEAVDAATAAYKHEEGQKRQLMQQKKRDALSIKTLAQDLEILQRMSEFLIEVDIDLISKLKTAAERREAQKKVRSYYDTEILPEITMLWKAMQLSNFAVGQMLIDSGLCSIDN